MIVTGIGIVAMIIIILLIGRICNKNKDKEKQADVIVISLLVWAGLPVAFAIIMMGMFEPTKMGSWEVKEAIEPTLLDDNEEDILNGYTYQYIIPERWSTKPNIINYTVDSVLADEPPILVRCERKAEPTIWTLGWLQKDIRYVFYNSDYTISEIELK